MQYKTDIFAGKKYSRSTFVCEYMRIFASIPVIRNKYKGVKN